uniref:Uncharacterized protein n=1 Tax=Anguilla anguilla TaxID=7936 RepID=A0A0E9SLW4_ANGAN
MEKETSLIFNRTTAKAKKTLYSMPSIQTFPNMAV